MTSDVELLVRIYHKRALGPHLYFMDALCPVLHSTTVNPRVDVEIVELCVTDVPDAKVGDVLRVIGVEDLTNKPKPPRTRIIIVKELTVTEKWSSAFNFRHDLQAPPAEAKKARGYEFHVPSFVVQIREMMKQSALLPTQSETAHAQPPFALDVKQPFAILQCHQPLANRVAEYFGGQVAATCTSDRLVYVFADTFKGEHEKVDVRAIFDDWAINPEKVPTHLRSIIQRIYIITEPPALSWSECVHIYKNNLLEGVRANTKCPLWPRKLICFPREIESTMARDMNTSEALSTSEPIAPGSPQSGEHAQHHVDQCDCIVFADGYYWIGLNVKRIVVTEKRANVPSAAYWKLLEISERYPDALQYDSSHKLPGLMFKDHYIEFMDCYKKRTLALDIGASPGGWSHCLTHAFQTEHVIAIDPGKHMHRLVAEDNRIESWQIKGMDALNQIIDHRAKLDARESLVSSQQGEDAAISCSNKIEISKEASARLQSGIGILVCDINDVLEQAVQILDVFSNAQLFEKPCLVALTFKNTCRTAREFSERKAVALQKVKAMLQDVREIHLFANTKLETTVVGQIL